MSRWALTATGERLVRMLRHALERCNPIRTDSATSEVASAVFGATLACPAAHGAGSSALMITVAALRIRSSDAISPSRSPRYSWM